MPHDQKWRKNPGKGYTWDESYTISENLFIAYQRGAGARYRALGAQYLDVLDLGFLSVSWLRLAIPAKYSRTSNTYCLHDGEKVLYYPRCPWRTMRWRLCAMAD